MNCKKCGNEIKEGNEFCTNCGHSLNKTKFNKLKEYKIPIIIITAWIVIMCAIIGKKAVSNKEDNENSSSNNEVNINSNIVVENATNNDIDQENNDLIDIQNQTFNLKEDDIVNFFNADPKYNYLANEYERSIVEDGNTIIYTNKTLEGTKTVGIKISTTNSKVQTIFFNYTSNEKLTNQEISTELAIQAAKGIDLIYFKVRGKRYNDLTDYEKVYDYILKFNDLILDNTYHKNLRYTVTNDSKSVTTTYEVIRDEETTTNLLEQIELIDPNNEYPVCIGEYGDYTEYWILDSEGNKIRFSDIEGFKNAIEIYKERANNTSDNNDNSNNSNSEDKQISNSNNQNTKNNLNSNFDNDEEEYEDTTITFSYNELKNKTEEELVKLFKEKGLVPKVNKETREVPYVDERADTTVITNSGYGSYEKGETVEIKATYYKPVAWKTYVSASVSGKSFNVKGKTCYTEQLYVNHDVDVAYCFYENPLGLNSYEINRIGRGVEFYINDKLIEKGSSLFKEYTFDKVETITFKVVAPYVYEFNLEGLDERGEGTMIDKNVILYEKKINVKDLYSGEGEKAKIEIN